MGFEHDPAAVVETRSDHDTNACRAEQQLGDPRSDLADTEAIEQRRDLIQVARRKHDLLNSTAAPNTRTSVPNTLPLVAHAASSAAPAALQLFSVVPGDVELRGGDDRDQGKRFNDGGREL
jgi:hypothetical protein